MHGDLRTTSLEQLCRTLDARQATGELTIDGDGNQIRVWFRQGRVVRAAASRHELRLGDRLVHGGLITAADLAGALRAQSGSGRHLGEVLVEEGIVSRHVVRAFMQEQVLDALFAAVRWTTGEYRFEEDEVAGPAVPTDLTVPQLLFALETRHRVWDEITRSIPDVQQVPEWVPGAARDMAGLDQGETAIAGAIDGERSIEALAEDLGFGPYEVAAVVHGLTVLGIVRLVQDEVPDTSANPAAAAATAISEAAAFLRGDGPPPTPLHEVVPPPAEPAPAKPAAAPEPEPSQPAPAAADDQPAEPGSDPLSNDAFADALAGVMAELDMDAPRGGRPKPVEDEPLAVLAPDPAIAVEPELAVAELLDDVDVDPVAAPGSAEPAEAAATAPAPPATPAGDEDEPTFQIMDEDLDDSVPGPPVMPPMEAMPARPDFADPEDDSPEPWAFVIGGGDAAAEEEAAPRPRRQASSPITAAVADPATGTPLPAPTLPDEGPAPDPEPEPVEEAPEEPSDLPPAPKRPRQTGEMSDLLRELRQLSDE